MDDELELTFTAWLLSFVSFAGAGQNTEYVRLYQFLTVKHWDVTH